jgi:alpha-beta hydrolase superfamily lysophospholipase
MSSSVLAMDLPLENYAHFVKVPPPDDNTKWHDREYGIRDLSDFAKLDTRSDLQKSVNYIQTVFHGAQYSISNTHKQIQAQFNTENFPEINVTEPIGSSDKRALVVFFHGLNGHPSLWSEHINYFESNYEIDIIAPKIPARGNCDIEDEIFLGFFNRIVDWTLRNPSKPVALFGQSNGSRIALLFETWLRNKAPQTPVYVSLTGPVLFGSKTVEKFKAQLDTAANLLFDYNVFSDLNFKSPSAKKILQSARDHLAKGVAERCYSIYAPFHDHYIYSLGSALPIINPNKDPGKIEQHYIIYNYGHNAVVAGIAKPQINECINWINKITNNTNNAQIFYNALKINYKNYIKAKIAPELSDLSTHDFIYKKNTFKDNRSIAEYITHPLSAHINGLCEIASKKMSEPPVEFYGQHDLEKSDGLIILLHGLNDGPVQWRQALENIKSFDNGYFNNYTIHIPTIPARGNADIETISELIGLMISKFILIKENKHKPIILIGTSNGGRLALYLKNIFAFMSNPSFLASIAGAHYGTEILSAANAMGVSFMTASSPIQADLAFGSEHAKETIRAAQLLHQERHKDAFLFFSSHSDAVVQAWDYHPSHPKIKMAPLGPAVKHVQVAAVGHLSIPSAVFNQILIDIQKWITADFKKLDKEVNNLECYLVDGFLEEK